MTKQKVSWNHLWNSLLNAYRGLSRVPEGLSSRVYLCGRPAWEQLFSHNVARRIRPSGASVWMQPEIPTAHVLINQGGRGEAALSHSEGVEKHHTPSLHAVAPSLPLDGCSSTERPHGGPMAASGLQNIMVSSVEAAGYEERRTSFNFMDCRRNRTIISNKMNE